MLYLWKICYMESSKHVFMRIWLEHLAKYMKVVIEWTVLSLSVFHHLSKGFHGQKHVPIARRSFHGQKHPGGGGGGVFMVKNSPEVEEEVGGGVFMCFCCKYNENTSSRRRSQLAKVKLGGGGVFIHPYGWQKHDPVFVLRFDSQITGKISPVAQYERRRRRRRRWNIGLNLVGKIRRRTER